MLTEKANMLTNKVQILTKEVQILTKEMKSIFWLKNVKILNIKIHISSRKNKILTKKGCVSPQGAAAPPGWLGDFLPGRGGRGSDGA